MGMLIVLCGFLLMPFSFEFGLFVVVGGFFWRGTETIENEVVKVAPVMGNASKGCGWIVGMMLICLLLLAFIFAAFGVPPEYLK